LALILLELFTGLPMIKDIQTASFFFKDGLNDNSGFRWCFCAGDDGFGDGPGGGFGDIGDYDVDIAIDIAPPAPEPDAIEAGLTGTDLGIPGIPGYSAPNTSMADQLDALYANLRATGKFKSRAEEYTDFFGRYDPDTGRVEPGRVGLPEGFLDKQRFSTLMDMQQKFGYAPPNVVGNTFDLPVTFSFGYLTQEDPELEEYVSKKFKQRRYYPYSKTLEGKDSFDPVSVPGLDLLMDPVIQDIAYSPTPSFENRKSYTQSVREASQAMTPQQRYGVLDPTIAFDDPRYGTRVGGYLPTLEQANLPTYMGGFRGSREMTAPFALTSAEANRYEEIFRATPGTRGDAIRTELDNAKPGQTVEEVLTEAGLSSFGLPKEAEASALANYMDREGMKGFVRGLGVVTSLTSPFMPAMFMGLPEEIYEDTIKPALNTLRENLDENVPGFKDLSSKFDVGVKEVEKQYENQVPETETVVDTIYDALFGKGKSQEAREFGSNYQLPSGVREPIEVGVEDIAPDFTGAEMAFFDPDDIGNPYAGLTNPELEAQLAFEASQRGLDRDLTEQVNRQLEETVFLDPETFPFPSRPLELPPIPETMAEAIVDQQGREASIARDAMLQGIPVELAAPVTPVQVEPLEASAVAVPEAERAVEIQQLAPLPEEVDIAQAAFTEPPVVETVSEISPDAMNAALDIVSNMIDLPGSIITIDDYLAIQNARTEKEFVEAVQKVIDKDRESGPAATAEKETGFTYKRGN
jgi:hypothetical protein